jgi:hypothetical protein
MSGATNLVVFALCETESSVIAAHCYVREWHIKRISASRVGR